MLKAPLSWMIAFLLILSIYSFLCLRPRRNRRRWIRRLFRRRHRSRSSAFRFHLFDASPSHFVGAGLDSAAVSALPIERFAALKLLTNGRVPSDCAVCLNPFDDDETLRFIPKCQHAFHMSCLDPWLEAHSTCPSCRASLVQPAPESNLPYDVVIAVDSAEIEEQGPSSGGFTLGTSPKVLWDHFWRQKSPLRLKVLVCRVLSGALSLDRRRRCAICGGGGETSEHLFFSCPVARALWYDFWGIRTDGATTAEWTTANWVEASLFPNRLLAFELEEEGEMFLFLSCLIDKIWALRNRVVDGQEDEVSFLRLKSAVEDSFSELRSAFCIRAG
ncbi:hypothetical protein V2J09_008099 [Rumex salicifolius]